MPKSNVLKNIFGGNGDFIYNENNRSKYELLEKYDLLESLDEMIFMNTMEIGAYLRMFEKVTEESRIEEFFLGKEIAELDMLTGDLSELAPIIYDRVNLYKTFSKKTVEEILQGFAGNVKIFNSLYVHYFDK